VSAGSSIPVMTRRPLGLMRRLTILPVVLVVSMSASAQARRPVLKASCAEPARALRDEGGTGLLRIVRLSGSLRIASVRVAGGQPTQSSGFALSRSRRATNAFSFRAKPLAGPSRTVRYRIRIVVRSVRFGRSVRTRIVTCVVRVVHVARAAPPGPTPPGTAPPGPTPPAPPPPVDQYVALGDSFAAGQGTIVYTDDACKRSASAHPALIDAQRANTELTFVACAGADTDDVRNDQLGALGAGTDIVTITVGANDVGFADALAICASQSDANCSTAIASANDAIANALGGLLDALYAEIRAAAPTATIVVVGYPRPFGPATCAGTALVSASEQGNINDAADAAGDVIEARAQAAGFSYVDPIPTFTGHAICSAEPFLNGADAGAVEGFHPNAAGHTAYAALVRSVIG
jgi:lysophospholipase L1-like esterase